MSAHLSEEEQIEALKRWWKDYGTIVLLAAIVGLGGFLGWNQYKKYTVEKARESSVVFEQFAAAMAEFDHVLASEDIQRVSQLAQKVIETSGSSLYSDYATLYLAKLAVEQEEYVVAKEHLSKVVSSGNNDSVKDLARLRLARVHFGLSEYDQALALLTIKPSAAYEAAYAEVVGDVFFAQKKLSDARTAYESALRLIGMSNPMKANLVRLKVENTYTSADQPEILLESSHNSQSPHASSQEQVSAEGV